MTLRSIFLMSRRSKVSLKYDLKWIVSRRINLVKSTLFSEDFLLQSQEHEGCLMIKVTWRTVLVVRQQSLLKVKQLLWFGCNYRSDQSLQM